MYTDADTAARNAHAALRRPELNRWIAVPLHGPNALDPMAFHTRKHAESAAFHHRMNTGSTVRIYRDGTFYTEVSGHVIP